MSNDPTDAPSTAEDTTPPGGRGRVLLLVGLVVVAIGLVLSLTGGDDPATRKGSQAFGGVVVEGPLLQSFAVTNEDPAIGQSPPVVEGSPGRSSA